MDWKEFIKPTKWKVIVTIVVAIMAFLTLSRKMFCGLCNSYEKWPQLIQSCRCGNTFLQFLSELIIIVVIIPFVIYISYSTVSYFIRKKKKKKKKKN